MKKFRGYKVNYRKNSSLFCFFISKNVLYLYYQLKLTYYIFGATIMVTQQEFLEKTSMGKNFAINVQSIVGEGVNYTRKNPASIDVNDYYRGIKNTLQTFLNDLFNQSGEQLEQEEEFQRDGQLEFEGIISVYGTDESLLWRSSFSGVISRRDSMYDAYGDLHESEYCSDCRIDYLPS